MSFIFFAFLARADQLSTQRLSFEYLPKCTFRARSFENTHERLPIVLLLYSRTTLARSPPRLSLFVCVVRNVTKFLVLAAPARPRSELSALGAGRGIYCARDRRVDLRIRSRRHRTPS